MTRRDIPTPAGESRGWRRGGSAARAVRLRRVEEVSAGGLVVRDTDDQVVGVLIAKHDRRGRLVWSLPKGHVEDGETLEQTAAREVEEETGVAGEVIGALGKVDYWFVFRGRKIHKTVHHFLLRWVGGELSDHDVEVVEVAWFPLSEIPDRLAYRDERRLMGQVRDLLAKSA
jgi:ADP-ribose pyrophosphatase YjhB (NUDIX family)